MMFFYIYKPCHLSDVSIRHKAAKPKERKENAVKISEEIMYLLCIKYPSSDSVNFLHILP